MTPMYTMPFLAVLHSGDLYHAHVDTISPAYKFEVNHVFHQVAFLLLSEVQLGISQSQIHGISQNVLLQKQSHHSTFFAVRR